jgi:hypothetical protein
MQIAITLYRLGNDDKKISLDVFKTDGFLFKNFSELRLVQCMDRNWRKGVKGQI